MMSQHSGEVVTTALKLESGEVVTAGSEMIEGNSWAFVRKGSIKVPVATECIYSMILSDDAIVVVGKHVDGAYIARFDQETLAIINSEVVDKNFFRFTHVVPYLGRGDGKYVVVADKFREDRMLSAIVLLDEDFKPVLGVLVSTHDTEDLITESSINSVVSDIDGTIYAVGSSSSDKHMGGLIFKVEMSGDVNCIIIASGDGQWVSVNTVKIVDDMLEVIMMHHNDTPIPTSQVVTFTKNLELATDVVTTDDLKTIADAVTNAE